MKPLQEPQDDFIAEEIKNGERCRSCPEPMPGNGKPVYCDFCIEDIEHKYELKQAVLKKGGGR